MTYEEAQAYIQAKHIYYDVGVMAAVNCPVHKFLTEVNGKVILGTDVPYTAIADKELFPAA